MSQVLSKSPKHCAKQGLSIDKSYKKLFLAFSAFFSTILAFIFLIWLILHPSKPQFSLREADIYQLNLSGPHLLNSSIQLTLLSKNPNKKVGIYYDKLQAYAAYKGQQITVDTSLPPFYQGYEESNLLTASLEGKGLPVASSFGYEVGRDQTAGRIVLNLKKMHSFFYSGRMRGGIASALLLRAGRKRSRIEVEDEILIGKKKGCKRPEIDKQSKGIPTEQLQCSKAF
ncbi:NDR1/HIN1-like protein 1 isoform X2 [Herrania umbratica]|uniref:NDR1/HIN1-like protein 1 isoform X2 n=1 Tax=Herrania umbratica TaxID=108875 RepID=A0A6J1AA09_9ROSI|nr:NDR1/HIN1-like protein 1 isoform X2 [Herrania umbratica]